MKKRILAVVFVVVLMAVSILPALALDTKSLPPEEAELADISPEEQENVRQTQGDVKSLPLEEQESVHQSREDAKLQSPEKLKLSEMTSEEQARFLREQGIEVQDEEYVYEFIARVITLVEEDPNFPAGTGLNTPSTRVFAWKIGEAVNKYYNRDISQSANWIDIMLRDYEEFGN